VAKTIVLVYSGGLDTSVCIPMLREEYGYERIVTVTVDVGQPPEDVRQAEEKAKALGTEHTTVDAKRAFVSDYCWPAVRANGATNSPTPCTAPSAMRPGMLPCAGIVSRCPARTAGAPLSKRVLA